MPASLHPPTTVTHHRDGTRRRGFGFFQRKERWSLTGRSWALAFGLVVCLLLLVVLRIHPFLAVTERTKADVLVVEGWLPNYALEECISEFHAGHYRLLMTVGGEILSGTNIDPGDNLASYAAARLKWLGLPPQFVQAVPSPVKYRDRTFGSALALRRWCEANHEQLKSFNLVTLGPHARRSRLLFEKAFDEKVGVGVIAIENREYDPAQWWRYSEGVKEVISEAVAYGYVRLFFQPRPEMLNR
jgi:hypothetical protein